MPPTNRRMECDMTVIQTLMWKPFPGKTNAMLERMKKIKAIVEKHGLEVQILTNVAGGASAGTYLFAMSCPDMKTWGAKFAEISADPEFQAIQAAVAEAPNADLLASAIWQEV